MKYEIELIQMSFDGEYVIDSTHETIEDASETSANLGSKWYFYPLSVIVKGQTIQETGGCLFNKQSDEPMLSEMFKNKRLTTLVNVFKHCSEKPEAQGMSFEMYEDFVLSQFLK